MNINDMFNQAQAAPDAPDFADLLGPNELKEGETYLCEFTYSKAGVTKNGGKKFTNKLKVLEGDLEGGEFFDTLSFSVKSTEGALSYNKRLFGKLQGAGMGAQFFASNPSDEAIASALKGSKVRVTIHWQKPGDDGRQFLDNTTTWSPADAAVPAGYVPGGEAPKGF